MTTRTRLLVIGYGNALRADDGFGIRVAQALMDDPPPGMQVIATHQLTPELAEALSNVEQAVFVDAGTNAPPGQTLTGDIHPAPLPKSFTHHVTPMHLLELARQLYGHIPHTQVITVGPLDLGHGEGLTPEIEEAAQRVIGDLRQGAALENA